jgi:hypothetical protein
MSKLENLLLNHITQDVVKYIIMKYIIISEEQVKQNMKKCLRQLLIRTYVSESDDDEDDDEEEEENNEISDLIFGPSTRNDIMSYNEWYEDWRNRAIEADIQRRSIYSKYI